MDQDSEGRGLYLVEPVWEHRPSRVGLKLHHMGDTVGFGAHCSAWPFGADQSVPDRVVEVQDMLAERSQQRGAKIGSFDVRFVEPCHVVA